AGRPLRAAGVPDGLLRVGRIEGVLFDPASPREGPGYGRRVHDLLLAVAEHDRLDDLCGVKPVGESLPDPLVLEERHVRVVQLPADIDVTVVLPLVTLEVLLLP